MNFQSPRLPGRGPASWSPRARLLAGLIPAFAFAALPWFTPSPASAGAGTAPSHPFLPARAAAQAAAAETLGIAPDSTSSDLRFVPINGDSLGAGEEPVTIHFEGTDDEEWLRAPFGDNLLTDPGQWGHDDRNRNARETTGILDYNRVDQLRLGLWQQIQAPHTLLPRFGARLEYSFGRDRILYGVQFEQPLAPPGRLAAGVSFVRRTDHPDLQQVDDLENSLALLFGRQDYRDYFEREGFGAYVAWRVPDFSTVSVHVRNDEYRSLETRSGTRSWFWRQRDLRPNPPVDEGSVHGALLRLERLAHRTRRARSGLYHWIELERAGGALEGDYEYTRALADVRSVLRLSPATSLALRGVAGSALAGDLPAQKRFIAGGVDGLRAHAFGATRGDQLALAQAEYSMSLFPWGDGFLDGGLQALVFVDAGRAWSNAGHRWDLDRQHVECDGGFGFATAEDDLRIYFAKNLQESDSDFVIGLRLQKPF